MTSGVSSKKYKIGIIGLGLIGSSILRRLHNKKEYELFCCSKTSFENALDYTKNSSCNYDIVIDCDLIFVCSKISQTLDVLNNLNSILKKDTKVVDVCSIKKDLLNKKFNFEFILSHPMAGTENSGFNSGFEELFENAKWLIEKEDELLNKIIKDLGAIPTLIDMKLHDKLCCQISHLPTILSFLLFDNADNDAKKIASSGFRDTTRLAQTNHDLAINMLEGNFDNIEAQLKNLLKRLKEIKKLSQEEKIELFDKISNKRKEMYDKNGKNIFKI